MAQTVKRSSLGRLVALIMTMNQTTMKMKASLMLAVTQDLDLVVQGN